MTATANKITPRTVVHARKTARGQIEKGDNGNPTIEVEITVKGVAQGDNFLYAHYLLNQAHREAMAEVDKIALGLDE